MSQPLSGMQNWPVVQDETGSADLGIETVDDLCHTYCKGHRLCFGLKPKKTVGSHCYPEGDC
jgi:hypothetical protein